MSRALNKLLVAAFLIFGVFGATAAVAVAAEEFDKFAIESASVDLSNRQAGAHADLTIGLRLTREGNAPYALPRDIEIKLPPGVIGNPQGIPRCTVNELGNGAGDSACPFESQVGMTEIRVLQPHAGVYDEPVYNMPPPKGGEVVARLGFIAAGWPAFINIRIDPTDYSVISTVEGVPSIAGLSEATTTLWGVPASPVHDEDRVTPFEAANGGAPSEGREINTPEAPFISNPTDCSLERDVRITARSYQLPERPSTVEVPFPPISGCGKLQFAPTFTATLTNPEAAAPTGIETELVIPQDETPGGLATSTMRSARVTLPEGVTINSAAADGLEACSADQVGYGTSESSHCPEAAKIGSVSIDVPALEDTLQGAVYQRTPEPGHMFRFWVVSDEQGVHLKLPAEIEANPFTGQLTTVFNGIESLGGLPQVPFSSLKLDVFGGPRAPLATPSSCGNYLTHYSFSPWSGMPAVEGDAAMEIHSGCDLGGFSPKLTAGSLVSLGGRFSPFVFTLSREDGEGNPQKIALHMPPGLLAKLKGVPLCPDGAAAAGSCPADSKVGSVAASSGVGGAPLWIPQPGKAPTAAYLSGPYRGAPYSVVSVVPAQAGPFDLGLVVNRAAISIDPKTTQASIVTDPLPQMLEGVPVTYRTLHVSVDRPEFTLNPTSCAAKKVTATVTAADGRTAEPSDGYQATGCSKLGFKPKLSLRLKGGTRRGSFPALRAVLTPRTGDANIAAAAVTLPHSAFLEQGHIRTICTRVQFNAGAGFGAQCPKGSIYGKAKAISPLIGEPLQGPVYLRSSNHPLPDLVMALHGPIDIELSGRIDAVNGGIRSTFAMVPDAPVSKFILEMQGGKKGLIVNSRNLCGHPSRADTVFQGQNGRTSEGRPVVQVKCAKGRGGRRSR
jgi:hypothetical protein